MKASGWSNGSPSATGSGYGIAISKSDRDAHFTPGLGSVTLLLEHGPTVAVVLSASFWRDCPEFRGAGIGRWLLNQGLAPWPRGEPPRLQIELMAPGVLRVRPGAL